MVLSFTKLPIPGSYKVDVDIEKVVHLFRQGDYYNSQFAEALRESRRLKSRDLCIDFCQLDKEVDHHEHIGLDPHTVFGFDDEERVCCSSLNPEDKIGPLGPILDSEKIAALDFNEELQTITLNTIKRLTGFIDLLIQAMPQEELENQDKVTFNFGNEPYAYHFSYYNPHKIMKDGERNRNYSGIYRITLPNNRIISIKDAWIEDSKIDEDFTPEKAKADEEIVYGKEMILGGIGHLRIVSRRFPENGNPEKITEMDYV